MSQFNIKNRDYNSLCFLCYNKFEDGIMSLDDLKVEYDKLQLKYGQKN